VSPEEIKEHNIVTGAFDVGVVLKGLNGLLEIIAGLFLLFIPLHDIQRFLIWVTGKELRVDKQDVIANHLVHLANTLTARTYQLTIAYLLIHGFVKVFLVVMLLRRRLWAYPVAIAVFTIFGIYQAYQYSYTHSALMLALTVLDVAVIVLTSLEYRILVKERSAASTPPTEVPE